MNVSKENVRSVSKIRINTLIVGEPAQWLGEWKQRGIITSYSDGIIQALKLYNEKQVEQDLKKVQVDSLL
ncbi:MAG: hypothetical protein FWD52_08965 [Candidatus Bathyarchaeota archaeon]|nr:hypothetical protein [Candidatus Termiticorpusculum sp.]